MEPNWALARKQQRLAERARIIQQIRAFFVTLDYLEVETPHRIPANAPEVHIHAVPSGDWCLQTSPELAMKRLLAAGYERIFQLCRVWRDGERGRRHLPEFTMLEWYRAGTDYYGLMEDCIALFRALCPEGSLTWQGTTIDLATEWERLTVAEAFDRYAPRTLDEALVDNRFEEILSAEIEPQLGTRKPTFLTEFPAALGALARVKPGQPEVAERFELYVCGLELANAFSELTDPREQRRRFEEDETARRKAGKRPWPLPAIFLKELSSMPASAGIALGVDRLIMLFTNQTDIAEVVAFPPESL